MSSPSPNSPPTAVPPASPTSSITPPPSPTTDASPPSTPSSSSAPPAQSPSPPVPAASAPSQPQSPPPPPPLSTSPASLHPPSSPPSVPSPAIPPPTLNSSPPPVFPPSPPSNDSPPLLASPDPPLTTTPPLPGVSPSPPPPFRVPSPPSLLSPPPPTVKLPDSSPPPSLIAPPVASSRPPPSLILPPESIISPPVPTTPPIPQGNISSGTAPTTSVVPVIPIDKPLARSTTLGPNLTAATTFRDGGGMKGGVVVAIGVVGILVLSIVLVGVWFTQKRKKKQAAFNIGYTMPSPFASSQNSDSSFLRNQHSVHSPQHSAHLAGSASRSNFKSSPEAGGIGNSRSWYTYEELAAATERFSENNLLGEGGFGCVYKGVLADGREVAVKQLKAGGGQGEREFRAEVEIISRIHHRHLVSLVGYCISECQRILVYDYVPNNTLHYHLHDEGRPVMNWATRIKVAAGTARGIAYLHEDCNPRIIHRDIKSANILLDNNFEAWVADFGLAKLAMELDARTHVSTRVMGTFG